MSGTIGSPFSSTAPPPPSAAPPPSSSSFFFSFFPEDDDDILSVTNTKLIFLHNCSTVAAWVVRRSVGISSLYLVLFRFFSVFLSLFYQFKHGQPRYKHSFLYHSVSSFFSHSFSCCSVPQLTDWKPVVIRKRQPTKTSAGSQERFVQQAQRAGLQVDTVHKC